MRPANQRAGLWRMQIANDEHDRAEAIGKRAWALLRAANETEDAALRLELVATARAAFEDAGAVCDRIWTRMAQDRGLSLEAFVDADPAVRGMLATFEVAGRHLGARLTDDRARGQRRLMGR